LYPEHVNEALAAAHIDTLPLGIDEHVMGILTRVERGEESAVLIIEHADLRGMPEYGHDPMVDLVNGEREVGPQMVRRPMGYLLVRHAIHGSDLVRMGGIHKDAWTRPKAMTPVLDSLYAAYAASAAA
jgi:hypothetical protein